MKFMNKLERRLGRHAIPNLMKYIVASISSVCYLNNNTEYVLFP
jgi:hypothetical protein